MENGNLFWMIRKYCNHCERCGSSEKLVFHHKEYPVKSVNGFEILCRLCHEKEHPRSGYTIVKSEEQIAKENDRKEQMLRMRLAGKSLAEIGRRFGLTKQRVYQILKGYQFSRKYVLEDKNPTP